MGKIKNVHNTQKQTLFTRRELLAMRKITPFHRWLLVASTATYRRKRSTMSSTTPKTFEKFQFKPELGIPTTVASRAWLRIKNTSKFHGT